MTKKYYWAMAVIAAFVIGTIITTVPAYAAPNNEDNGVVEALMIIVDKLMALTTTNEDIVTAIEGIEVLQGPTGEGCTIQDTIVTCGDTSSDVEGPQGEIGPQGPQGDPADFTPVVRTSIGYAEEGDIIIVRALCQFGEVAIGGGYHAFAGQLHATTWKIGHNCPTLGEQCADAGETPTGWKVSADLVDDIGDPNYLEVFVICADILS